MMFKKNSYQFQRNYNWNFFELLNKRSAHKEYQYDHYESSRKSHPNKHLDFQWFVGPGLNAF